MLFAEAEGFAHLHLHVVPRMADLEPALRGPGVLKHLEGPAIPDTERDRMAQQLQQAWPNA